MPGFAGYLVLDNQSKVTNPIPELPSLLELERIDLQTENCRFCLSFHSKFKNEQVLISNPSYTLGFHGNLLNLKHLSNEYGVSDLCDLLWSMYQKLGIGFIRQLKGYFSGILYDKKELTWFVFTDRYSSKPIYYSQVEHRLLISSHMKVVAEQIQEMKKSLSVSELGAYCLMTYGYMLEDVTLFNEIKKLRGLLIIKNGIVQYESLYSLDNTKMTTQSYEAILGEVNERFQEAITLEYEKDRELHKRHLVTLSGGLDCRVNVFSALSLGYQDMTGITFSQSGYLDHLIAQKIASDQGIEFLFYSLDNGLYLKDIHSNLVSNDGLIYYAGAAHQLRACQIINWDEFAITHTGQVGEILKGAYLSGNHHKYTHAGIGAFSNRNITRISDQISRIHHRYPNDEMFTIHERAFNGIINGLYAISQFGEFASPFMDNDFLDYTLTIPPEYRFKGKLYQDWMIKYLPASTNYVWEHTHCKINIPRWLYYSNRAIIKISSKLKPEIHQRSMNPFKYWYQTNSSLSKMFKSTYNENISLLESMTDLARDTAEQFRKGSFVEKAQVITLLKAIKYHTTSN